MSRINPLTQKLSEHFSLHSSRLHTLVALVRGALTSSNVHHNSLARFVPSPTRKGAERRVERFFAKQKLATIDYAKTILSLLPSLPEKIVLCLDRTNWMFGMTNINYLVLSLRINRLISIPFLFEDLDKAGSSNTGERISLMQKLLQVLPGGRIQWLLGDREFVGKDWIQWLHENDIPFCLRIKKDMHIPYSSDMFKQVCCFFEHLPYGCKRILHKTMHGVPLCLAGTRSKKGDLVIVMSNQDVKRAEQILNVYRNRWSIEEMFKKLKTAGFFMENTHMKKKERLVSLMIVLGLAMVMAYLAGWTEKIRFKKTLKCPERSRFRAGLLVLQFKISQTLGKAIRWMNQLLNNADSLIFPKSDG